MALWTAFMIGLIGSFHCVGMCGPIALSLACTREHRGRAVTGMLWYNAGRVTTYILLGLFFGWLGRGLEIAGLQTYFAIAIGLVLILVALFSLDLERALLRIPVLKYLHARIQKAIGRALQQLRQTGFYKLGILNGLLPCGLVYMAVVGAISMGTMPGGALYMLLFGLGTVPLMLATPILGRQVNIRWRRRLRRWYPAFLFLLAGLFLMRGLQFELPPGFLLHPDLQQLPMCW